MLVYICSSTYTDFVVAVLSDPSCCNLITSQGNLVSFIVFYFPPFSLPSNSEMASKMHIVPK